MYFNNLPNQKFDWMISFAAVKRRGAIAILIINSVIWRNACIIYNRYLFIYLNLS